MPSNIISRTDILISPDNHTPLSPGDEGFKSGGTEFFFYPIHNGVALLLPQDTEGKSRETESHQHVENTFHYAAHYQTDAEQFDYFEPIADGAARHENLRLHQTVLSEIPSSTTRLLDVGCGNAWAAAHLCPRGTEVWSLDISTVNPAKALHAYPFDNHYAVAADVFALPFQEGVFDAVIAVEVIEHVADPARFISCLLRVLRPGGVLIITTPYKEIISYSLCIHCNHPTPHHAHLHSFDERSLSALVPGKLARVERLYAFSNKALVKMQTHVLLRFLPFFLWKWKDHFANMLIPKPSRLLMRCERHVGE